VVAVDVRGHARAVAEGVRGVGRRDLVEQLEGAARVHGGEAAAGREGRPDHEVVAAVAVDVRARDGAAEGIAGRAGERVQEPAGAAGVEVGVALGVAVLARRAAEDVVDAVPVDVAGVGDREAVLVAGLPDEPVQDAPRCGRTGRTPRPGRRSRHADLAGDHLVAPSWLMS
jgi:hypothetical protein